MTDAFGSLDLFSAFSGTSADNQPEKHTYNTAHGESESLSVAEVVALRRENAELRERVRLHERFSHLIPSQTPLAEIDFFKSVLSAECQSRIESELYTVLCETRDSVEENAPDGEYEPYTRVLYLPYCMIDASGRYWNKTPVQYGDYTPLFTAVYNVALDDTEDKLDMFGAKLPKENQSNGPECFNCGGPHRLADCKEPRDKKRIAEGLKQFKESRGGPNHNDRYHVRVVKEIEARFKEFVPGKLSDSLRTALGLEDHDLAPHLYRMRNFGYPPGYSLDPPLSTSEGMQLYYNPGTAVKTEEGEVEETPVPCVVDYPGYTGPPGPDVIDKYQARVYSAVAPTLSDKRKRADAYQGGKRRRVEAIGKQEDDMEIDSEQPGSAQAGGPAHRRAIMSQPPLPPPVPAEEHPSAPSPPPSPPGLTPAGEAPPGVTTPLRRTLLPQPAAASTPLPPGKYNHPEIVNISEDMSQSETNPTEPGDVSVEILSVKEPVMNRSIVSETNAIGIKFDQTEDYGPLDKRAGNFSKLQCILRSRTRSKSTSSTPSKTPSKTGRRYEK